MLRGWNWTEEDEKLPDEGNDVDRLMEEERLKNEERYKVPLALEATYTPAEVEQLILLFDEMDTDDSGTVDVRELRVMFDKMEEDISDEHLQALIDEVDDDESGEMEFGEFLHLFASFKEGGSKFSQMSKVFGKLDATPLKILENECKRRGLTLKYVLVDIIEANSMHPTQFIMSVEISGVFKEIDRNGKVIIADEVRTYQGIGKNTRASKFNAATVALSKLREHIPGIDFEPGVIPENWMSWFEDNVERGVDVSQLLQKLTVKGFYPCRNILFMQKLSLRVSMREMQRLEQGLWPRMEGRVIPIEWENWAKRNMERGIHGKVILQCLVENGFIPEKNPILTELLTRDAGGGFSDKIRPREVDFWSSSHNGEIDELRCYIAAGQDADEGKVLAGHKATPLSLAIKNNQVEACKVLVLEGNASVNLPDDYGRLSTHMAAQVGNREILEFLISQSAHVCVVDRYGDTPLHIAASMAHVDIVRFLADWYEERLRRFFSGKDILAGENLTFSDAARTIFERVVEMRLSRFATQVFRKVWMLSAVQEFVKEYNGAKYLMKRKTNLKDTVKEEKIEEEETGSESESDLSYKIKEEEDPVLDFVQNEDPKTSFFFPTPTAAMIQTAMNQFDLHPEEDKFAFNQFSEMLQRVLASMWVNMPNSIGRTPLMCATDQPGGDVSENHQRIMQMLMNEHACCVKMEDNYGKTVKDMIQEHLKNLGGEYLQMAEKEAAERREEEAKQAEESMEPLMGDPLYKFFETSGEIAAQWRLILGRSSRLREMGTYSEMIHEESRALFYCDDNGNCQWAKPLEFEQYDHTLYGWTQMRLDSKLVSTQGKWDLHVHNTSSQRFYHNFDTNEFQWNRPKGVKRRKKDKPKHNPDSVKLVTKLGFWSKYVDNGLAYFVNEKHQKYQYERPVEWSSYADSNESASPENWKMNWELVFVSSELVREFGKSVWEERKELTTNCYFYWNRQERTGSWAKPREVMAHEQGWLIHTALRGRENGRVRKKLEVLREILDEETGIEWKEERDVFRTPACENLVTMVYYVGKLLDDDDPYEGVAQGRMPKVFQVSSLKRKKEDKVDPTKIRRVSTVSHLTTKIVHNDAEIKMRQYKNMLMWVEAAEERANQGFVLCSWGCKDWIEPHEIEEHRHEKCRRRQVPCQLGCFLILRAEQWKIVQETHLALECPKRRVPCESLCGEMVQFDLMSKHMTHECLKRAVPPVKCKFDCGWQISGGLEDEESMKWEAHQHESHVCPKRILRCDFPGCMAEIEARDRPAHRQEHLHKIGILTWTTAGSYKWRVPKKCKKLLIHLWGAGGGSGMLQGRRGASGGGGAFVEAEIKVFPGEELIVVVGGGGQVNTEPQPDDFDVADAEHQRISRGGFPGGGDGVSNNYIFSCGGGGGYSAIIRQGAFGEEVVVLAAGGGGGGTRNGSPGGDETFDCVDFDGIRRNGSNGNQECGGVGGDTLEDVLQAEDGMPYQGGRGGQFGGGGGGGIFGGGGGGFTPGVVGGGGGGSSYINVESVVPDTKYVRKLAGKSSSLPGGMEYDIPAATGLGDWDYLDAFVGFGGTGAKDSVSCGLSGAVRIKLPRYYETSLPETRLSVADFEREWLEGELDDDLESCITCREEDIDSSSRQEDSPKEEVRAVGAAIPEEEYEDFEHDDSERFNHDEASVIEELDPELLKEDYDETPEFVPGALVMCYYQGKRYNEMYPAVIADVNPDGTFEIEYEDGDYDSGIRTEFLKLRQ